MQLSEMLLYEIRNYFVGRTKELEMIRSHVAGDAKSLWLHFYGQGGIGKSTLLQHAISEFKDTSY